jgi:hypothetical protein
LVTANRKHKTLNKQKQNERARAGKACGHAI